MKKKISKKDLKDWKDFLSKNEKLYNKDNKKNTSIYFSQIKEIDLHGYSLDEANLIIKQFIIKCFNNNVKRINIITGKGSRSKNKNDPYQSLNMSILKNSVPHFILKDEELKKKIKSIDLKSIEDPSRGNFQIHLKV